MDNQFTRTESLIGKDSLEKLFKSRIAVFGIGGVGSYVVEALARAGIGSLDLIDNDIINITNINRQLIALNSTIGEAKVEIAKKRILDINPNAQVTIYKKFFSPENSNEFDFSKYDYIIDAIDSVQSKIALYKWCMKNKIPFVSSMGAARKTDI